MFSTNERTNIKLSIVAPCYNEQESLNEFWQRAAKACALVAGTAHEIILVDDGSSDQTWSIIEALSIEDPNVVGVRLLRNHGHQLAATAGLAISRGDRVMLIDADLQDPPELLPKMMALMDEGAEIVYGTRISRAGESWFKLATASMFYRLLSSLTDVPIPQDTGDFRLMSRRTVEILTMMPERNRFLRGMVSWIGGKQVALPYERQPRFAGTSKYPVAKMLRFAVDAITSFSTKPLRLAVWLGLGVSMLAFILLFYAILSWVMHDVVPGWASTLVSTSLFAGTQLLVLGIFGEYLGRAVENLKQRPLFLIDSVYTDGHKHVLPIDFSRQDSAQQRAVLTKILPRPSERV